MFWLRQRNYSAIFPLHIYITLTFIHLAISFMQCNLYCFQGTCLPFFLVITFPGNLTHELQESKYLKHMIIVSHTSNIYIQMKYTSCLYDAFSFCRSTRLVMCFYVSSGVTKNLRKRIRQSGSLRVRES